MATTNPTPYTPEQRDTVLALVEAALSVQETVIVTPLPEVVYVDTMQVRFRVRASGRWSRHKMDSHAV